MATPAKTLGSCAGTEDREERVRAARQMVVSDPEILGGTPVIRGTRVPVYTIAGWVANGETMETILDSYGSLTKEQVELAAVFAEEFPYEEEPYQFELPPGATLIYRKTVPLRKA